jgi:NAD(P)-dependent dehydrogenase (short-subunit alcohol dehydrogenase family)
MTMEHSARFANKAGIVTGSAGGIGEGIARRLASEGAKVIVADLDETRGAATAEAIRNDGGEATYARVDIADEASTQDLARFAKETYGRIDFLVNNAALFKDMVITGLHTIDLDYYFRFMRINLHGCLIMSRAVIPTMREQGGGAICNTSSTAAYMQGGAYSVAKLGVNGITFSLASELGPDNIRVNAIAPGPTDTAARRNDVVTDEYLQGMLTQMPLRRLGRPADHGAAVAFLLSDDAQWITGHILNVDGGQLMRV